jgi:Concanavalin A-like lectin/glucanases superfamily/DnaJ domain
MDQLSKCYLILGLDAGASQEQVKQAYRDLVNVWHPDRFSHNERLRLVTLEKIKEINGAYEFLKASFFEADIASATNATSEAEAPNVEPDEEIPKPTSNRGAMWLVLAFLICALASAMVFFLKKTSAINRTNESNRPTANSARAPGAINSPIPPSASHALAFNGDRGYVAIAMTGSLTGTFTVECWALTKDRNRRVLINSRGPTEYGFDMKFQKNRIHSDIGDGSRWLTTTAGAHFKYATDAWYHIAYVVTPDHYTIYIDGILSASEDHLSGEPVLYDARHPLSIGLFYPDNESFQGFISEVKIWKTARSQVQIQADMSSSLVGTEPGLQGYWHFNDGAGEIAADSSGHGFSGTLVGTVMWATNAAPILFQ